VLSESSSETAGDERYRKFILHFSLLPWSTWGTVFEVLSMGPQIFWGSKPVVCECPEYYDAYPLLGNGPVNTSLNRVTRIRCPLLGNVSVNTPGQQ
jgi:hypothetical protein